MAIAGAIHIPFTKSRTLVPSRCSVAAAVSHSSSLRRVTKSRVRVRAIASHISRAWSARKKIAIRVWPPRAVTLLAPRPQPGQGTAPDAS